MKHLYKLNNSGFLPCLFFSLLFTVTLIGEEKLKDLAPLPLQKKYFYSMPRAFGILEKIDLDKKSVTVRLDNGNRVYTTQLTRASEVRTRNTYGELRDLSVGMEVMLFMLLDENKKWLYPRAIVDHLSFQISHKFFASVHKIDRVKKIVSIEWEHKRKGKQTRELSISENTKVHIARQSGDLSILQEGMKIVYQLKQTDDGLEVVEIFDEEAAISVQQQQKSKSLERQVREGIQVMTTYSDSIHGAIHITLLRRTDVEITGKQLKAEQKLLITREDGSTAAATVRNIKKNRLKYDIELLVEPGFAARFSPGDFSQINLMNESQNK